MSSREVCLCRARGLLLLLWVKGKKKEGATQQHQQQKKSAKRMPETTTDSEECGGSRLLQRARALTRKRGLFPHLPRRASTALQNRGPKNQA